MRRDGLGRRATPEQPRGGGGVRCLALGPREVVIDGVADERVHERQRLALEQVGRGQCVRRGDDVVHAGQRGDVGGRRAVAQHRDGPGHLQRVTRQPGEAGDDRLGDGAGADLVHARDAVGVRCDLLVAQEADELARQQRVAARRLLARGREGRVRLAEETGDQPACRLRAQRGGGEVDGRRVRGQLGQQRAGGLRGPLGRDDEHRQAIEPLAQIGQEAQRGVVAPLDVVDREHERLLGRGVGHEPVQGVQRGEGGLVGVLDGGEDAGGRGRGALQPRRLGRLEELAHDAEREGALERARAGGEHPQAVLLRGLPGGGEQGCLADPGTAADQRQGTVAGGGGAHQIPQHRTFGFAFQQGYRSHPPIVAKPWGARMGGLP